MVRTLVAFGVLLTVSIACRDGPTALAELTDQAVDLASPIVSADALATFRELLDDELVRELADLAAEEHPASRVWSAMHELQDRAATGDAQGILDALALAERKVLGVEEGGSDDVVLSALELILDSARDVLDGESEAEEHKDIIDDSVIDNRPNRRTR